MEVLLWLSSIWNALTFWAQHVRHQNIRKRKCYLWWDTSACYKLSSKRRILVTSNCQKFRYALSISPWKCMSKKGKKKQKCLTPPFSTRLSSTWGSTMSRVCCRGHKNYFIFYRMGPAYSPFFKIYYKNIKKDFIDFSYKF